MFARVVHKFYLCYGGILNDIVSDVIQRYVQLDDEIFLINRTK